MGQASYSQNGYLFSGALSGWRQPKLLRALQNSAARYVYRIPTISETQAIAYLVFLTQPNPGDTVTISEQTYEWVTSLSSTGSQAYEVVIGATTAASATNLNRAITADLNTNSGAGTVYGTGTASNPDVCFYPPGNTTAPAGLPASSTGVANIGGTSYSYVQIGSVDFGASYNLTPVAESSGGTRTSWLKNLLALGDVTTTYAGGTNPSFNNSITSSATWLEFLDQDTNVIKSQVVDDEFKRFYFASPSQKPQYNTYDRIQQGKPAWLLGIPASGCTPGVAVAGGGNSLQLGYTTAGAGTINGLANQVYLIPVTPTGATVINDVEIFTGTAYPTANFAAVVYEDANGKPGGLLGTGEIVGGISGTAANISTFVNPPGLIANTQYWIGVLVDTAVLWTAAPAGTNTMASWSDTFSNGPTAQAPTGAGITLNQPAIHMFADCTTSDVIEDRAYLTTYVSAYNEEGPPSPATLVSGWSNGVWTVTMFGPLPDDMGVFRNIQYQNLYRTQVGNSGQTTYFYVATFRLSDWAYSLTGVLGPWYGGTGNLGSPTVTVNGYTVTGLSSTTGEFTDTLPDNYVTLNAQLPSTTWFEPPANLQGLVAMPNGIMAGWVNNEVWFCQPYFPHAWPPEYVLTTDFPIVGLGVTNGALVVVTSATPYVVNGTAPSNMSMVKSTLPAPCSSRGSILSGDGGVLYCSPNGLIEVESTGQAINTTDLWIKREDWQQLTPQEYTRAIYLSSCYFCFGSTSPLGVVPSNNSQAKRGFTIELDTDSASFTIWPQPGGHRLGFNLLTSHILDGAGNTYNIDNVLNDPWTGIGLLIGNGNVYQYDFTDPTPAMIAYDWKSKVYQQNNRKNYAALRVFFTVPPNTPPLNQNRNTAPANDPSWNTLQEGQYLIVKTYADVGVDGNGLPNGQMVLVSAREVRKNGELIRLPSGYKAEQIQFEIMGRIVVSNVQAATSVKELANV